jgi:hypothetical protein
MGSTISYLNVTLNQAELEWFFILLFLFLFLGAIVMNIYFLMSLYLSYVLFQVPCLKFLIPVTRSDVGRPTLCYWGCESWSVP